MFYQTFPQEISFPLKIKVHNLPQSKNFRNSPKFPRTMSACPSLFTCLAVCLTLLIIISFVVLFDLAGKWFYPTCTMGKTISSSNRMFQKVNDLIMSLLNQKNVLFHKLVRLSPAIDRHNNQSAPSCIVWHQTGFRKKLIQNRVKRE